MLRSPSPSTLEMNIKEQKPSEIFTCNGACTETWFVLYVARTCRCRDIKPVSTKHEWV